MRSIATSLQATRRTGRRLRTPGEQPEPDRLRSGTYRNLCGPFALNVWILANGRAPPVFPTSEKRVLDVEGLNDARTKLADLFSILLEQRRGISRFRIDQTSLLKMGK